MKDKSSLKNILDETSKAASSNEIAQYTQKLTQLINDLEHTLGEFQIEK